jgi:hypothetical protein
MDIDELKDRIRGALHAGFEFRSGLDGQTSEHLADAADQHDDLGAAQLLEHLASDVDNLDADVTSSFIALVSEHDDRGSVFLACSLADAAGAVGVPSKALDWRPWQPQTATDFLRYVIKRARVSELA